MSDYGWVDDAWSNYLMDEIMAHCTWDSGMTQEEWDAMRQEDMLREYLISFDDDGHLGHFD